jgi:hypothetical protein
LPHSDLGQCDSAGRKIEQFIAALYQADVTEDRTP